MNTYKSYIGQQDIKWWDGIQRQYGRRISPSGTVDLLKIDNTVNVLAVYGAYTEYTHASIQNAVSTIGTTNKATLELSPGTWAIDENLTIPGNLILYVPYGAELSIASGKTLTINRIEAGDYKIFSGLGTVVLAQGACNQVLAEWTGVRGDGTDKTTELVKAVTIAKTSKLPLLLPSGTITANLTDTVDLTGIPALIGNNTIVDLAGATSTTHFKVEGTKTLVASAVAVNEGDSQFTIAGTFNVGDLILIVSDENIENTKRTYLRKGSRHRIDTYSGGVMTIYPAAPFAITSAYFYHVSQVNEPFFYASKGITFSDVVPASRSTICLKTRFAKAVVESTFLHFGNVCVLFADSEGGFTGRATDSYFSGTTTSYGVAVMDLSEISVVGAFIARCRHAVATGGGSNWLDTDAGGSVGTGIALPARVTISGGFYQSSSELVSDEVGAIDAHGIAYSLNVSGATIVGGISVGSKYSSIVGNTIISRWFAAIYFADNNSIEWGNHLIQGNQIVMQGNVTNVAPISTSVFVLTSTLAAKCIQIKNNSITYSGLDAVAATFTIMTLSGECPDIIFTGNTLSLPTPPTGQARRCFFYPSKRLTITDNDFGLAGLTIYPRAGNTGIDTYGDISRNRFRNGPGYGIYIDANTGVFGSLIAGTYVSATSFTVVGDQTASFLVGRRIKVTGTATGTVYGYIVSSTFSVVTTVVVLPDNGALANEALSVYLAECLFEVLCIENNVCDSAYHGGIAVEAGTAIHLKINGNRMINNNQAAAAATSGAGIFVAGQQGSRATLECKNNFCSDFQPVATQRYGIYVLGAAAPNCPVIHLVGNDCRQNVTTDLISTNFYEYVQHGNRNSAGTFPDAILGSDGNYYQYNGAAWVAFTP